MISQTRLKPFDKMIWARWSLIYTRGVRCLGIKTMRISWSIGTPTPSSISTEHCHTKNEVAGVRLGTGCRWVVVVVISDWMEAIAREREERWRVGARMRAWKQCRSYRCSIDRFADRPLLIGMDQDRDGQKNGEMLEPGLSFPP